MWMARKTTASSEAFLCRPSTMNRGQRVDAHRIAVVTPRTTDTVSRSRLTTPLPRVRYQSALVETTAVITAATPRRGRPSLQQGRAVQGGRETRATPERTRRG